MLSSIARASRELDVCKAHTRKQIREGVWPAYRLGKRALRVDVSEIRKITRAAALAEKEK